jgi:hypothetical protein
MFNYTLYGHLIEIYPTGPSLYFLLHPIVRFPNQEARL